MVTLADEQQFATTDYRLVRTDDGQVLLTRPMRPVDADSLNQLWRERGIPTRWERLQNAAVA